MVIKNKHNFFLKYLYIFLRKKNITPSLLAQRIAEYYVLEARQRPTCESLLLRYSTFFDNNIYWSMTPEGYDYWRRIEEEWEDFYALLHDI